MSEVVEFIEEVCGLYFRSIVLPNAGDKGIQHVHDHDHATYIGSGAVRLYVDGAAVGEFPAGRAVAVIAGHAHEFEALAANTRLTCVHDVASAQSIREKGL